MSDSEPPKALVFLPVHAFAVERVFPIRNLVGQTGWTPKDDYGGFTVAGDEIVGPPPLGQEDQENYITEQAPHVASVSTFQAPPYPQIPPDESIRRPSSESERSTISDGNGGRRQTERSQYVPSRLGPPGVLPGTVSSATEQVFHRCEDEPIHIPGAIQSFGALLALKYSPAGDLEVRIASENIRQLLEYGAEDLFELKSFFDIIEVESGGDMSARIQFALSKARIADDNISDTDLDILPVSIILPDDSQKKLWCALHISKGTKDLIVCEFEVHSNVFYPEDVLDTRALPKVPVSTVGLEVEVEESLKSTVPTSKPLRVLDIARRRKQSGLSSMDIFSAMTQAQQQLASARTVQAVLDIVVGIVAEITGFHRVMFYRFDSQKNGCVEAELINPQASVDMFRGLHFPASDIPEQARELYKINRIRILYDRDAETARLVCREESDFEVPLDLSHSYLRAISPIHLKYLSNMEVRSSMSVSIVINDDLWGLIACHHYGEEGIRVTLPMRELCRNIGECVASNIERLVMLQRIEARKPPKPTVPAQNPASFIAASSADLLRVFGADFGLLSIQDEARAIGKLDPYREALAFLAYLQARRFTTVCASQNINADFPDIKYQPEIHAISGVLIIPLSSGGKDFLVFFRKGQLREIRWAGNPYEKLTREGSEYLEPRASFKRWTEIVRGMSKEWNEDQLEIAAVLGLLYGRFMEVWRQKEAAGRNNRMTRLLIQNSSHEVRTPLNAIVNYLEMALENPLDDSTREILIKAHKASRSLIYVIDDLLNLTKAEEGPIASPEEVFDLGAIVSEVISQFRREAMRKSLDLTISMHQGLPDMVKGDASRLRQVLSNVTSNAFQHSVEGGIKVVIRPIASKESSSVISITVQDVGMGMSEQQLDELFQEFEQVLDEDTSAALNSGGSTPSGQGSISSGGAQPLGVGLAVVARYVRNMKGQIRVHSEPGKGTIFGMELPFEHAKSTPSDAPSRTFSPPTFEARIPQIPRAMSDTSRSSTSAILDRSPAKDHPRMVDPAREHDRTPLHKLTSSPDIVSVDSSPAASRDTGVESPSSSYPFPKMPKPSVAGPDEEGERTSLLVLIAEDNPINSRLLARRLLKLGHKVEVMSDGQMCYDHYRDCLGKLDVILMDIQMPLVDGIMSTKMIRVLEAELSPPGEPHLRVPIIAVSASLKEESRFDYIQCGFDAWILKPINFVRLDFLLKGIKNPDLRREALYHPGHWELGGWFSS